MTAYLALPRASANRVYGAAALGLAAAELSVLDERALGGRVSEPEPRRVAGVDYLAVDCPTGDLSAVDLSIVANLSGLHALYAVDGELLRPIEVAPLLRQDEDVVTIQRYVGKTNEALTHLLVNLALAVGPGTFAKVVAGEPVRLLDPACGRGTTLNRAVVYGLDAVGIEHDARDVDAYEAFFLGWLKDKRLKHQVDRARLRKGRDTPASRWTATYGASKDRATHRVVDVVRDDTTNLRDHLVARSVDLLVCDLPYGVQHGSTPDAGTLQRSPADLLDAALPVWWDVLRPGAGAAFAWNLRTLPRPRLVGLLEAHGLELCVPADDERFQHRVDRSITRDVVVARRPTIHRPPEGRR